MTAAAGGLRVWHRLVGRRRLVGAAALSVFVCSPASAQTLQGRVLDQSSERPLPQALVQLLDADAETIFGVVTDSLGAYSLRVPSPGEYYVSAEQFGYEPTRSPLFRVEQSDGVFNVDLSVQPSPLGLPGFSVTAERFSEINQRLRLLVGRSPASLRVAPIMRPAIEEHLARSHNVEDLLRWSSIPSLEIRQTNDGPCFLVRPGARTKVPESCVSVLVNGVPLTLAGVPALPLDLVETIVVVMPDESIQYPRGAVLLYTAGWIR